MQGDGAAMGNEPFEGFKLGGPGRSVPEVVAVDSRNAGFRVSREVTYLSDRQARSAKPGDPRMAQIVGADVPPEHPGG